MSDGNTAVVLPGATATGLALSRGVTFTEWRETGHALARVGRACPWWIGDWMNFGEEHYGELYAQAISELGLDYQTLSNYAWIARTYDKTSRQENLSWRHHLDAAGIQNPSDRAEVLLRAATEGWSTRQVRAEANRLKALAKGPAVAVSTIAVDNVTALSELLAAIIPRAQGFTTDDPLHMAWTLAQGLDAAGVTAPRRTA